MDSLVRPAISRRIGRPVYRLSIIRGGAYDAQELREALDQDEVAARHYAGFRRANLRIEKARFNKPVYVSYRVGDAIYWTDHPVVLPYGETVLTDGVNYARARCGNRIETKPQTPVQPRGPAPEELETPEAPSADLPPAWHQPLLAPDMLPPFYPDTPAQTLAMIPIILPDAPAVIGFGMLPGTGGIAPFQLPTPPAPPPSNPTVPIQPPPIPNLPPVIPPTPPQCCLFVPPPQVPPPTTPPSTPPDIPPATPPSTPPYFPPITPPNTPPTPPYFPPSTPPGFPPSTPPFFPPSTPPNTPPFTPPNTPPITPPNTPPLTPPNIPPDTPPGVPPNSPPDAPVPEPGTALLMLLPCAIAGVALTLKRRRERLKAFRNR